MMFPLRPPRGPSQLETRIRELRDEGALAIAHLCPAERVPGYSEDTIFISREVYFWRMTCPGSGAHAIICHVEEENLQTVIDLLVPYKKILFPRRYVYVSPGRVGGD